jgi:predicted dehydrogenase
MVSYTQGWLSRVEDAGASAQAAWRTDPARSGDTGAFGDIGSHAFHLVETVTGERVIALCADLRAAITGRVLDDDGAALLRLSGGGRGTLVASQVATGDINQLDLAVYGETASLHWRQEDPNRLVVKRRDRPAETWTAGTGVSYLSPEALAATRVPAGHPEGYIEAFANIYRAFANAVAHGGPPDATPGFGTLDEALRTMNFLHAAKASSDAGGVWTDLEMA